MASKLDISAAAIVYTVLAVAVTHYGLPIIHYFCIGCFRTQKFGQNQTEPNIATIDAENPYVVSKEEAKAEFKYEKSVSRVFSMHFTFWAYVWIIYFAVTSGLADEDFHAGMKLVLNVLGYIHLPVFILFLWIEMCLSWEAEYLGTMKEGESCKTYIQALREIDAVKILGVGAYHYEMKTRTYTYTGANGVLMTGSEVYQEKIQDHVETMKFPFTRCEDCSADPEVLNLDPDKVTRIKMLKLVLLGDERTKEEFDRLRAELEEKVQRLYPNSTLEFAEEDGIPLFEERVCAYWEDEGRRWWTRQRVYIIVSLLLLTWFYRIAFRLATQSACYKVVKKIYV